MRDFARTAPASAARGGARMASAERGRRADRKLARPPGRASHAPDRRTAAGYAECGVPTSRAPGTGLALLVCVLLTGCAGLPVQVAARPAVRCSPSIPVVWAKLTPEERAWVAGASALGAALIERGGSASIRHDQPTAESPEARKNLRYEVFLAFVFSLRSDLHHGVVAIRGYPDPRRAYHLIASLSTKTPPDRAPLTRISLSRQWCERARPHRPR